MSLETGISPHGGQLVDLMVQGGSGPDPAVSVALGERQQCDFEMMAIGAFSPLTGFMGEADYNSVCEKM